jgi:hypothetical protein
VKTGALEAVATAATAAAAALATTTVATTTTAAAAETAASTAASEASTAARALLRFVDADLAAVELRSVELADGVLSALAVGHGHERETARTPGFTIRGERDLAHLAHGSERCLDGFLAGRERQISYEETISHGTVAFHDFMRGAFWRLDFEP